MSNGWETIFDKEIEVNYPIKIDRHTDEDGEVTGFILYAIDTLDFDGDPVLIDGSSVIINIPTSRGHTAKGEYDDLESVLIGLRDDYGYSNEFVQKVSESL